MYKGYFWQLSSGKTESQNHKIGYIRKHVRDYLSASDNQHFYDGKILSVTIPFYSTIPLEWNLTVYTWKVQQTKLQEFLKMLPWPLKTILNNIICDSYLNLLWLFFFEEETHPKWNNIGQKPLLRITELCSPTALPWVSASLFIPMSGKQIRLMDDVFS